MGTISDRLRLVEQKGTGRTLVELYGTNRVLVERHSGIRAYGAEHICIGTTYGTLSIMGSGLKLCCMSREQVFISGTIDAVSLERRDG